MKPICSSMGYSTTDRVVVWGHDLPGESLGRLDLGAMAYLEITGRMPTEGEARVFNALLVTLVEHGMTPQAMAARLVFMGAPDSLQGAVAAGLCGVGSRFGGGAEAAARMLQEARGEDAATIGRLCRGIAVIGRAVGLVGHIAEELRNPIAPTLWQQTEEEVTQCCLAEEAP